MLFVLTFSFSENPCNVQPHPIKDEKGYEKGCKGARLGNSGLPRKAWCDGDNGRYPWYGKCCEWKSNACVAKGVKSFTISQWQNYKVVYDLSNFKIK